MQTEEEKIAEENPIFPKTLSRGVNVAIEVLIKNPLLPEDIRDAYWRMAYLQDNSDGESISNVEWENLFDTMTKKRVFLDKGINRKIFMRRFRSKVTNQITELLCDSEACEKLTFDQVGALTLILEPISEFFVGKKENLGIKTKSPFCPKAKKVMDILNVEYPKIINEDNYDEDAFIMDLKKLEKQERMEKQDKDMKKI